ncbi:hypothetical protein [Candidatus Neptunochlamydia vexilliferae]|uniref:hypothetical protein n=1 Tax=Candidatus Neptunichlamydia vexilliferae TaxID=1651774 RepID=UPI001890D21F|nr:hypothetical protein [Candidatus Neptunochlamydia vexilliferae]
MAQESLIWSVDAMASKGGKQGTTARVWRRGLAQFLFWYNVNMVVAVTQHEVFGHGYRLRELGVRPKGYMVSPWGGWTSFNVGPSFRVGNLQAMVVAGLEAGGILARDLKVQWIGQGEIDGRLSTTYTQAAQSLFWYTLITHRVRLKGDEASDGNDIEAYLKLHQNIDADTPSFREERKRRSFFV